MGQLKVEWHRLDHCSSEQAASAWSSTDFCFACTWLTVNCSNSRSILWEAGVRPGLGMGHTAGPSDFVSLSSVSVLPVSQYHEMGWTCRLLLNFLVKDLDKKTVNYRM